MATVFVRHTVQDFGRWKQAYDEFDAERKSMGVTDDGVYQADGNANDVTVYHDFATMASARAFVASTRLKEVMEGAGVQGPPDIWFTQRA